MSTQGGLKHATTEPSHLDKRERRRGASASGRAAALRRAPSDSDCSGETASLSADSAERVAGARPPPQPTRQGRAAKSRSRRRGSEWEVLEGLKDGQRFDRRPEVYNGYLHKKRKWPLKGWHKRFFVIDGGILVYARSPTDVARGRLHGSVDVGLSVISAKARRRRIDIDADEFIYHLRAKTPDVFRTWLNVLKVHRLYRQHLLTFGARESVPKIHAPLEDQPPTDTPSRTSHSSANTSTTSECHDLKVPSASCLSPAFSQKIACYHTSSIYHNTPHNPIDNWCRNSLENSEVMPLNFEPFEDKIFDLKNDHFRSMCSMNCMARMYMNEHENFKIKRFPNLSLGVPDEKQMHSTDLDQRSLRSADPTIESSLMYAFNYPSMTPTVTALSSKSNSKENCKRKRPMFFDRKIDPITALWFFTRKSRSGRIGATGAVVMRRSKKCTNLVKYRNLAEEPALKKPLSRSMLLGKYKVKLSRHTGDEILKKINKVSNEIQVGIENKENKSLQDTMTVSEYDKITERIILSIFGNQNAENTTADNAEYINQIVKELYEVQFCRKDSDPIKTLFKSLLEYWLKNSTGDHVKEALQRVRAIDKQSNKYFTKDQKLSGAFTGNVTKETQLTGLDTIQKPKKLNQEKKKISGNNSESFEKERRIQELERLLKNTVYICETVCSTQSKDKDIKITKKLIDNLERLSRKETSNSNDYKENSHSSTELPKIQETINHLINETSIPPNVAKEFLGAYLDVLLHDSSSGNGTDSSTTSADDSNDSQEEHPLCDVQTESVQKKVSKSITTLDKHSEKYFEPHNKVAPEDKKLTVDPGQLYLRDILDNITTIFNKVKKSNSKDDTKVNISKSDTKIQELDEIKDELGRLVGKYPGKSLISENHEDNSIVINLSKYDLQNISMFNDKNTKGMMSITIQLKEKPPNFDKSKPANLNLKFSNDIPKSNKTLSSTFRVPFDPRMSFKNPYIDFGFNTHRDQIDLKPFLSNSEATSKAYFQIMRESEHSLDLSFRSNNSFQKETTESKRSLDGNEDLQSCYVISTFKKSSLAAKFQCRKKVRMKECNGIVLRTTNGSPIASPSRTPDLTVFEKPAPRTIDEKFILLLLENLTLLSSTIPSLHKEINNLYLKLRKRHEKIVKNSTNIEGLGLLGKIYNDDSKKTTGDNETQFDVNLISGLKGLNEASVNTSRIYLIEKIFADQCLSAYVISKEVRDCDIQTEERKPELLLDFGQVTYITTEDKSIDVKKDVFIEKLKNDEIDLRMLPILTSKNVPLVNHNLVAQTTSVISAPSIEEVVTTDKCISNMHWNEQARNKDNNVTNDIKCTFENADSRRNFIFVEPTNELKAFRAQDNQLERDFQKIEKEIAKRTKNERRRSPKLKQDLIKEIRLLSPSFKVSTQSQTDKPLTRLLKETQKDFNVYQLFLSNQYDANKSNSVTDSSIEIQKSDDLKTIYRCSSYPSRCSGLVSPTSPPMRGPQAGFVSGTPGGRLASWIIESGGPLENASRELGQAQLSVQQLQRLLDALELQHQVHHDTDVSLEGASPNVKKDRRKFGLRKKKSNSKCASVELAPPHHIDVSGSHTALSALTAPPSPGGGASSMPNSAASLPIACAAARPQSLPGAESLGTAAGPASLTSLTPDQQLREDFTVLAKDLLATLKGVVSTLVCERGRLRAAMDAAETTTTPSGAVVTALRTNLSSALQQNSELRSRLSRIHDASDLAEMSSVHNSDPQVNRPFQQSLSYSSSCVSASEFFDAEEHDDDLKAAEILPGDEAGVIELDGDSSSEAGSLSSGEESASSDNSDGAMLSAEPMSLRLTQNGLESRQSCWARRTCLPCPRPTPGGPSLWNLLYKNIGKDLSQISMPVTINEPLNMLQRLCEELEYSELLDAACECRSGVERMALVAAFAVSAYAGSAHRAASKPFNPLLAETYECVRDDRGFRFLAEQVSHHPPISACHAESPRWCFWQEARIKTKFWGKSMEFQPTGQVHVRLVSTGDHYSWNKVTTCVHNLFGGQRWVDQYGDMHIKCHGTDISCKLNFIKASSWSSSRHEVRGAVTEGGSGARLRLQGRWSEALYAGDPPAARCLWRPGAMPPEHELYYGFTRFAMELNELEPGMRGLLPPTDTRLRPDQRALEEGDVESAEQHKHELEQAQRERRRDSPEHTPAWFRKTVEGGEETWVFSGEYWKAREAGFGDAAPRIW